MLALLGIELLAVTVVAISNENKMNFGKTENLFHFIKRKLDNKPFEDNAVDKCMINLFEKKLIDSKNVIVFISDNFSYKDWTRRLQTNFTHTFFTKIGGNIKLQKTSLRNIVVYSNKFTPYSVLKSGKPTRKTKFFVVVKTFSQIMQVLKEFWNHRIVNILVIYNDSKTIKYLTYFPYSESNCGSLGVPILMAECSTTGDILRNEKNLFPDKTTDLHKCPINATFTRNYPLSYYGKSGKPEGWEVELLMKIIKRMNGIANVNILNTQNVYNKSTGYTRLLENADIGGGMVISLGGLLKTDFCLYEQSLCSTWAVPKYKVAGFSIDFLYKIFSWEVWLMIPATAFAMTLAVKISSDKSISNAFFTLLPLLFGNSVPIRQHRFTILGGFWILFCITMNTIYQKGYQSSLLVPILPKPLRNTDEVLKSGLNITGMPGIFLDSIQFFKGRYSLGNKVITIKRFDFDYKKWMHRVAANQDIAVLGFKEIFHYNLEKSELADKIHIQQSCVMKYSLGFVLRKNSHLTERFTHFAYTLHEKGFTTYLMKKYLSQGTREKMNKKFIFVLNQQKLNNKIPASITMDKMTIIFLGYLLSLSFASLIFVIEILIQYNSRKKILKKAKLSFLRRN